MAKGKSLDGYLEVKVAGLPGTLKQVHEAVDCMALIEPKETMLEFRPAYDEKYPHRPYLHMVCAVKGIKAREGQTLPGGQTVIELLDEDQPELDAVYEFCNDEICELVCKGLYQRGFQAPQMFSEIIMNVPSPKTDLILVNNGRQTGYYVRIEDSPIHFSKETMENTKPLSAVFEKHADLTETPELDEPEKAAAVSNPSVYVSAMKKPEPEPDQTAATDENIPENKKEPFAGFMAMTEPVSQPESVSFTEDDPYSQYRISEEEMMAEFLKTGKTKSRKSERKNASSFAKPAAAADQPSAKQPDFMDADREWNQLTKEQKAALIAKAAELESRTASASPAFSSLMDQPDDRAEDHDFDFMK